MNKKPFFANCFTCGKIECKCNVDASLEDFSCPICRKKPKAWIKSLTDIQMSGKIVFLVQCWDGAVLSSTERRHLYLIKFEKLPTAKKEVELKSIAKLQDFTKQEGKLEEER